MDKKAANIIKYVISAVLALLLLWLCFRHISWESFLEGMKSCRWGWVVVSMVLGATVFVLRALRWHMLITPLDPSMKVLTVLDGINIGYLVNIALSRVGELVRCGVVSRRSATDSGGRRLAPYDKVLGTIVLDRVWDAVVSLLLVAAALVLMWGRYDSVIDGLFSGGGDRGGMTLWIITGLAAAVVIYGFIVWALRDRSAFCSVQWKVVRDVFEGMRTCFRMERSWRFFLYTAAIWALYVLMISSVAEAFPALGLDGWDCLFLMAAGSVASIIPVPGGFGAYHYVVAFSVAAICGVPFATGLVFATVSHESQVLTQLICGGASLISQSTSKQSI